MQGYGSYCTGDIDQYGWGFLYTFVVKVPSGFGVTKMSRTGMELSGTIDL